MRSQPERDATTTAIGVALMIFVGVLAAGVGADVCFGRILGRDGVSDLDLTGVFVVASVGAIVSLVRQRS